MFFLPVHFKQSLCSYVQDLTVSAPNTDREVETSVSHLDSNCGRRGKSKEESDFSQLESLPKHKQNQHTQPCTSFVIPGPLLIEKLVSITAAVVTGLGGVHMSVGAWGGKVNLRFGPPELPTLFSDRDLGLPDEARLADQPAQESLLFQPPQLWDYKGKSQHLSFYMSSGDQIQVLCASI